MSKRSIQHLPRNVWVLTITSLLNDISSEMLVNLIPFFLANVLGVRTVVIGLIEGIAETIASLIKIASVALSDRLGKRKWLTVAGYSLSAIANLFCISRMPGAGCWASVLQTASRDALIAVSIEENQRGLSFGLHRTGDGLGNSSDAFILLRGQERGLSLLQVMGMALTFNAVYAIFAGPLGAWSDKIGRRKLILGGWLTYGLVYLGFAFAQMGWQVWALFG